MASIITVPGFRDLNSHSGFDNQSCLRIYLFSRGQVTFCQVIDRSSKGNAFQDRSFSPLLVLHARHQQHTSSISLSGLVNVVDGDDVDANLIFAPSPPYSSFLPFPFSFNRIFSLKATSPSSIGAMFVVHLRSYPDVGRPPEVVGKLALVVPLTPMALRSQWPRQRNVR